MKGVIVANGTGVEALDISQLATPRSLLIVTDGAAARIARDIAPGIICGDFDSISAQYAADLFPTSELLHLPDQNSNDLEKAIVVARDRGCGEIEIHGAFGGRIDHMLTTFSLMVRYHSELPIVVRDGATEARIASDRSRFFKPLVLNGVPGEFVSVIPLSTEIVASVSGVEWPLEKECLRAGSRGVSNRAEGGEILIDVEQGMAVIVRGSKEMP